jgi:hypothetical protein
MLRCLRYDVRKLANNLAPKLSIVEWHRTKVQVLLKVPEFHLKGVPSQAALTHAGWACGIHPKGRLDLRDVDIL